MFHNSRPEYRRDIDGLRAVAVLSVVIYHVFPSWLPGGFAGVDVFFVVSGFLISTLIFKSLDAGKFSFADFYVRRIKRIFPSLSIVLLAILIFGWRNLLPDEFELLGRHLAASAGFVQNFILEGEAGYFDTASEYKPLLHIWSLGIEEQFYLVFPLAIYAVWKVNKRWVFYLIIAGISISFALNFFGPHSLRRNPVSTFFSPHTRLWEFLAGTLLAYASLRDTTMRAAIPSWISARLNFQYSAPAAADTVAFIGLGLVVSAFVLLEGTREFPGAKALLPVLGTILVIMSGPDSRIKQAILGNKPIVFIGLISYPLYLWHWPLVAFARIFNDGVLALTHQIAVIVASIVLATATYLFIERPIRSGHAHAVLKAVGLVIVVAAIGVVGLAIESNYGYPSESFQKAKDQLNWNDEWLRIPDCHKKFGVDEAVEHCVVSDASDGSVLLIGDSHSNHLWPGLNEALPGKVVNLFLSGCAPFPDLDVNHNGQCPNRVAKIYEYIERQQKRTTIIIAGFHLLYYSGYGVGRDPRRMTIRYRDLTGKNAYLASLEAALRRLTDQGRRVVFVADFPELGFDPITCFDDLLSRLGGRLARSPCAIPRESHEARRSDFINRLAPILKKFPTVVLFDPLEALCDDRFCWGMRGETFLYRDGDHLSFQGSRAVATALRRSVLKAE
jgi:peptidoglycan/LPS O-acetylase OafA/YrhL